VNHKFKNFRLGKAKNWRQPTTYGNTLSPQNSGNNPFPRIRESNPWEIADTSSSSSSVSQISGPSRVRTTTIHDLYIPTAIVENNPDEAAKNGTLNAAANGTSDSNIHNADHEKGSESLNSSTSTNSSGTIEKPEPNLGSRLGFSGDDLRLSGGLRRGTDEIRRVSDLDEVKTLSSGEIRVRMSSSMLPDVLIKHLNFRCGVPSLCKY